MLLGGRGKSVAAYLDRRRLDRYRERLVRLADATFDAGLSQDELLNTLETSDDLQELFEKIAETAQHSRYDRKIQYLGKVLANAARGTGGDHLDTAWLRVRAVDGLEPMHVQLL